MKYFLSALVAGVITGALVFFLLQNSMEQKKRENELRDLKNVELSVQKKFDEITLRLSSQLQSFAKAVANDRDFSLRLLVENDRSSPDITRMAQDFLAPMNFSFLEITDSSFEVLSSGHFPANAGNSIIDKAGRLSEKPVLLEDNVMGSEKLTLQLKEPLQIAEIPFYVMGGVEVNEKFLASLSPREGVTVLLRRGNDYLGKTEVHSVSEIRNHKILINDNEYYAAQLSLPYSGDGDAPVLIIVLEK